MSLSPVRLRAVVGGTLALVATSWLLALPTRAATQKLTVHSNGRFLVKEDGSYFPWNGDTSWWLYRLRDEDIIHYLNDRAAKGFNVIQGPHIFNRKNAYGQQPYFSSDPTKPNIAYFKYLDRLIEEANQRGMYVVLQAMWAQDAPNFTTGSARTFGQWLGDHYKNSNNVIWSITGEYEEAGRESYTIFQAVAEGLEAGHGGNHLMTIHPSGNETSSDFWHNANWLDFNMIQSGQEKTTSTWTLVQTDYAITPAKPTLNAEAWYEGPHPITGNVTSLDARKAAYWSVFAGGFGHTYGSMGVWDIGNNWKSDLHRPGAEQMQHLQNLLLSRPPLSRGPDQDVLVTPAGSTYSDHIRATRDLNGSYAFVYIPRADKAVSVKMNKISGSMVNAWWYDPRNGNSSFIGSYPSSNQRTFTTPANGSDWVLVLDDQSQNFPAPGSTESN